MIFKESINFLFVIFSKWLQCALPASIYIEKMYIIIALWSFFLFFLSLYRAVIFLISQFFSYKTFIEKHLERTNINNNNKKNNLNDLKPDDVLVLKLIKENTSDYDLSFVIAELNE